VAWGIVSSRLLDVFIQPDHLNTPRLIANQAGTTVWRNDNTEPFGNSMPNDDPDGDGVSFVFDLRFPGQFFDRETNLAYNYFRDYDLSTGRYVESDPIGLWSGVNTYLYVRARPTRAVDFRGLEAVLPTPPSTPFPSVPVTTIPGRPTLPGWLTPTGVCVGGGLILLLHSEDAGDACDDDPHGKKKECSDKRKKEDDCWEKCKHLLPSPSGDLQASEYRKCYRECMGSLF